LVINFAAAAALFSAVLNAFGPRKINE